MVETKEREDRRRLRAQFSRWMHGLVGGHWTFDVVAADVGVPFPFTYCILVVIADWEPHEAFY